MTGNIDRAAVNKINVATGTATLVGTGGYSDVRGIEFLVPEPNTLVMGLLFPAILFAKNRRPRVRV